MPRQLVDQTQVLGSTGAAHVVTGNVADPGEPFRVTLVWMDAPGPTSGAPYVNDLDLTLDVGGNLYRGNVFSGASSTTGGSADIRNNTESVFLPAGVSGPFTATVMDSSGSAWCACRAAKRPAPPEPRMRISVRRVFICRAVA